MFELKYSTKNYHDEVKFSSLTALMKFIMTIGIDSIIRLSFVDDSCCRHRIKV